ncbi:uncharacterized protein BO97DRAFT_413844 [Aspergillus homomorphus CBS 101889]|uniref:Uncharacterized protein n=1 Tax=Aspergillus homomorphus (strain CBS 101889) TaxID=1450537 RepID=A0A395HYC2_ASPHC|nr:hypothetical protein BO97DRAFT_413844 [Aspergillus homomorphus CBS 101889]RAL12921.1 hypothetical protein BO97DRAFT_413844 [Aspergillus homomorphus CBS 101889]
MGSTLVEKRKRKPNKDEKWVVAVVRQKDLLQADILAEPASQETIAPATSDYPAGSPSRARPSPWDQNAFFHRCHRPGCSAVYNRDCFAEMMDISEVEGNCTGPFVCFACGGSWDVGDPEQNFDEYFSDEQQEQLLDLSSDKVTQNEQEQHLNDRSLYEATYKEEQQQRLYDFSLYQATYKKQEQLLNLFHDDRAPTEQEQEERSPTPPTSPPSSITPSFVQIDKDTYRCTLIVDGRPCGNLCRSKAAATRHHRGDHEGRYKNRRRKNQTRRRR